MPEAATPTGSGSAQPRNPDNGQFQSIRDAASSLESLLNPSTDNQGEEEEQQDTEAETPEGEEAEASAEEETESEEGEETDPESEEGEEQEQPAAGRKFTVRVDGKDEQVGESELIAGYQRQSDYTRKTQGLANERKQFEQELNQARQERAEYAQLLPQLRKALEQGSGQEPDWAKLQADDAANGTTKFVTAWANWQMQRQRLASVRAEEQRVAKQQSAEAEAARGKALVQEREQLLMKLPEWRDDKVAHAESRAIAKLMKSVGYGDDDVAIHDHRALIIARKAAKYDEIMAAQPGLRRQASKAPVVKPGGGTPRPKGAADAASKRLSQTGSVRDAASLLENLI